MEAACRWWCLQVLYSCMKGQLSGTCCSCSSSATCGACSSGTCTRAHGRCPAERSFAISCLLQGRRPSFECPISPCGIHGLMHKALWAASSPWNLSLFALAATPPDMQFTVAKVFQLFVRISSMLSQVRRTSVVLQAPKPEQCMHLWASVRIIVQLELYLPKQMKDKGSPVSPNPVAPDPPSLPGAPVGPVGPCSYHVKNLSRQASRH